MKKGGLTKANICFETEISRINLKVLKTEDIYLLKLTEYQIGIFCLSRVIEKYDPNNIVFKNKQLVLDCKMQGLIDFLENEGDKLIPPVLEVSGNNLIIRDGKHRIGLCWHLGIVTIPFLYLKSNHLKICKILE